MEITLRAPVTRTPRVQMIQSMFDVPDAAESVRTWNVNLPLGERDWNIGLITGPSGSGKITVARTLFPQIDARHDWDGSKSILDGFPAGMSVKDIAGLLSSVGFGTVPSWLRAHHLLSTGEAARADLARALASDHDPGVVDAFTSTVDRQRGPRCAHGA